MDFDDFRASKYVDIYEFYDVQKRRPTGFEALELQKFLPGGQFQL